MKTRTIKNLAFYGSMALTVGLTPISGALATPVTAPSAAKTLCSQEIAFLDRYVAKDEYFETGSIASILIDDAPVLFGDAYQRALISIVTQDYSHLFIQGPSLEQFSEQVPQFPFGQKLKIAEKIWNELRARFPVEPGLNDSFAANARVSSAPFELNSGSAADRIKISRALSEIETHPTLKTQTLNLMAESLADYTRLVSLKQQIVYLEQMKFYDTAKLQRQNPAWSRLTSLKTLYSMGLATLLGAGALSVSHLGVSTELALTAAIPVIPMLALAAKKSFIKVSTTAIRQNYDDMIRKVQTAPVRLSPRLNSRVPKTVSSVDEARDD